VIGFVSQFFFIDIGALSSTSTLAVPRAPTTAGLARGIAASSQNARMEPIHVAVSGMTIRLLPAKESLLAGGVTAQRVALQTGSGELSISWE